MHDLEHIYQELINLSKEIGQWIKDERLSFNQSDVEIKGFNNFVSYVDKQAEQRFVTALEKLLPEAGFIAEEGTSNKNGERFNWVIDPLDGTTNYVHGIPFYCTSVALLEGKDVVMGVVYDPSSDECFHAFAGKGAFMNSSSISVSDTPELIKSLLATGFPYDDFDREEGYFGILRAFTQKCRGIRRIGSAALDLVYVANGRFDGFYEYGLNPWDVAAGALIVIEAGGQVSDFKGEKDYIFGEEIIADNKLISDEFFTVISHGFRDSSE